MNKEPFFAGLFFALIIGMATFYYHENFKQKQVVDKNGQTSTCQVIRYRFWYTIQNCSNPALNQKTVGLNEIKDYKIQ